MRPLQICIGPTVRIGRENWCLPYAGFFFYWTQIYLSVLLYSASNCNKEKLDEANWVLDMTRNMEKEERSDGKTL